MEKQCQVDQLDDGDDGPWNWQTTDDWRRDELDVDAMSTVDPVIKLMAVESDEPQSPGAFQASCN